MIGMNFYRLTTFCNCDYYRIVLKYNTHIYIPYTFKKYYRLQTAKSPHLEAIFLPFVEEIGFGGP